MYIEFKALEAFADPGDSVVLLPIGRNGYHTDVTIIDQCGLVRDNTHLAALSQATPGPGHDRCLPPTAFASLEPDVLAFTSALATPQDAPMELEKRVRRMVDMGVDEAAFYPDFAVVELTAEEVPRGHEDLLLFGVGMRRARDGWDAGRGWRRFYRRLGLDPGVDDRK